MWTLLIIILIFGIIYLIYQLYINKDNIEKKFEDFSHKREDMVDFSKSYSSSLNLESDTDASISFIDSESL